MRVAFVIECQNLNSASLRMKGLNSSELEVGREGPSSVRNTFSQYSFPFFSQDNTYRHHLRRLGQSLEWGKQWRGWDNKYQEHMWWCTILEVLIPLPYMLRLEYKYQPICRLYRESRHLIMIGISVREKHDKKETVEHQFSRRHPKEVLPVLKQRMLLKQLKDDLSPVHHPSREWKEEKTTLAYYYCRWFLTRNPDD